MLANEAMVRVAREHALPAFGNGNSLLYRLTIAMGTDQAVEALNTLDQNTSDPRRVYDR